MSILDLAAISNYRQTHYTSSVRTPDPDAMTIAILRPAIGLVGAALLVGACDSGPLGYQAIAPCDHWYRTDRWGAEIAAQTLLQECQVQTSDIEEWAGKGARPGEGYP